MLMQFLQQKCQNNDGVNRISIKETCSTFWGSLLCLCGLSWQFSSAAETDGSSWLRMCYGLRRVMLRRSSLQTLSNSKCSRLEPPVSIQKYRIKKYHSTPIADEICGPAFFRPIDLDLLTSKLLCQLLLMWVTSKFERCMFFRLRVNGGNETDGLTDEGTGGVYSVMRTAHTCMHHYVQFWQTIQHSFIQFAERTMSTMSNQRRYLPDNHHSSDVIDRKLYWYHNTNTT